MKEFVEYIKVLRDFYNLLLLDVSELLYLDFIKDYNQLKRSIRQFYDHLGALAKLGTTSIVFTNFFYYYQIFNGIFKPETIQIHIYPSDVPPFWEAQFINPPEWNGRKSLFRPFKEEVPFLIQY